MSVNIKEKTRIKKLGKRKERADHHVKQIKDTKGRFIGSLMRMEGNDVIIGINNQGKFVCMFDGLQYTDLA